MKYLLLALSFALPALCMAQKGQPFPSISGELLKGGTATLPENYSGKMTIVGMAWSKKSEDALKTWYEPLYDKFVLKRGIFDSDYDVQLCMIPMYIGLKQAAYESTMSTLRESNRTDLFPYILFYKGPIEPYDSKLGLVDKATPYFFLVDEKGKIRHAFSGIFTETKMERLEEVISMK